MRKSVPERLRSGAFFLIERISRRVFSVVGGGSMTNLSCGGRA